MRRGTVRGAAVLVIVLLGWGLLGCAGGPDLGRLKDDLLSGGGSATPASGPSRAPGAPEPPPLAESKERLSTLTVSPAGSMAGYDREDFPHWAADGTEFGWPDTEGSCDVRDDALIRDGRGVRLDDECAIYAGAWLDPYTGRTLRDPQDVDIDHLVPLANAYRSGASGWGAALREDYANDPLVLLSADDGTNQSKGDKGPEAWRPPNRDFWCEYSRRWVWVKSEWRLTVTGAEKSALSDMLATCETNATANAGARG